jgi:hypothetical protein
MLYSNKKIEKENREMKFGNLDIISLGERGRGRFEVVLPSATNIEKGINKYLTIGRTRNGNHRIKESNIKCLSDLYLILDSEGVYTRHTHGTIGVSSPSSIKILEKAHGAYGQAGNIGTWSCLLLKVVNTDDIFIKIKPSGGYKTLPTYLHITSDHEIYEVDELEIYCDMKDIDVPTFTTI